MRNFHPRIVGYDGIINGCQGAIKFIPLWRRRTFLGSEDQKT